MSLMAFWSSAISSSFCRSSHLSLCFLTNKVGHFKFPKMSQLVTCGQASYLVFQSQLELVQSLDHVFPLHIILANLLAVVLKELARRPKVSQTFVNGRYAHAGLGGRRGVIAHYFFALISAHSQLGIKMSNENHHHRIPINLKVP